MFANSILLLSGIAMSVSGLIIQIQYHLLKNPDHSPVLALNRMEWNEVHVWTAIVFLAATVYHVWAHRKWYKSVIKKHTLKPTLLLTFLTLFVVISGLIPLFMLYGGGDVAFRFSLIEIHDKIGILFFIVVFRHTAKRFKWYLDVFK